MSNVLIFFMANLPSVACVASAAALALRGCSGWGWFLFIAVITAQGMKLTTINKPKP